MMLQHPTSTAPMMWAPVAAQSVMTPSLKSASQRNKTAAAWRSGGGRTTQQILQLR